MGILTIKHTGVRISLRACGLEYASPRMLTLH
jgi:hypothetical protein